MSGLFFNSFNLKYFKVINFSRTKILEVKIVYGDFWFMISTNTDEIIN